MKALIIGDCHGTMPKIPDQGFDIVLCVGDICGGTDEMRSAMFKATESDEEWYEIFGEEAAKQAVIKSIRDGKKILSELNSFDVPVLVVPGNWDWTEENSDWEFLKGKGYPDMLSEFENVKDVNFCSQSEEGWNFIGYGPCSGPEIPQYEDDRPEDDKEMEDLQEEYKYNKERLKDDFTSEKTVFISHNTPQNTSLDKIDNTDSPVHGRHYGSIIVRELIEEFNPEYSIAGHIHEAEGIEKINETECLNTGLNSVWVLDTEEGISKFS